MSCDFCQTPHSCAQFGCAAARTHLDCQDKTECRLRGLEPEVTHRSSGLTVTEWRAQRGNDCDALGLCQGREPACEGCAPPTERPGQARRARWLGWVMTVLAVASAIYLLPQAVE